jgi:membrane protease YdiL (CAAX protease family)
VLNIFDFFLDILFFILPLFILIFVFKIRNIKDVFKELGLKKISFKSLVKHTCILFFLIFCTSFFLSFVFSLFGFQDLSLVSKTLLSLPKTYLIYLFIVRVFFEEWFFRGFLVKRIGVILSSIIFACMHIAYGSIVEIFGAFVLGVLLGRYFQKTNNLWPNYLAHMLYNVSAFLLLYFTL